MRFNQQFSDSSISNAQLTVQQSEQKQMKMSIFTNMRYVKFAENVSKKEQDLSFRNAVEGILHMYGVSMEKAADISKKLLSGAEFDNFEMKIIRMVVQDTYSKNPTGIKIIGYATNEEEDKREHNELISQTRAQASADGLMALFEVGGIRVKESYFQTEGKIVNIDLVQMYEYLEGKQITLGNARKIQLPKEQQETASKLLLELGELVDINKNGQMLIRDEAKDKYYEFIQKYKVENPYLNALRGTSFEINSEFFISSTVETNKVETKTGTVKIPIKVNLGIGNAQVDVTSSDFENRVRIRARIYDAEGNEVGESFILRPNEPNQSAYASFELPKIGEYKVEVTCEYLDDALNPLMVTEPIVVQTSYMMQIENSPWQKNSGFPNFEEDNKPRKIEKAEYELDMPMIFNPNRQFAPIADENVDIETSRLLPSLASFGGYKIESKDEVEFQNVWAKAYYLSKNGYDATEQSKLLLQNWDIDNMQEKYFKNAQGQSVESLRSEFRKKLLEGDAVGARQMLEDENIGRMLDEIVGNSNMKIQTEKMLVGTLSVDYRNRNAMQAIYRSIKGMRNEDEPIIMLYGFGIKQEFYQYAAKNIKENGMVASKETIIGKGVSVGIGANASMLLNIKDLPVVFGFEAVYEKDRTRGKFSLQNPVNNLGFLPIYIPNLSIEFSPDRPNIDLQIDTKKAGFDIDGRWSTSFFGAYATYKGQTQQTGLYGSEQVFRNFGAITLVAEQNDKYEPNSMRISTSFMLDLQNLRPEQIGVQFDKRTNKTDITIGIGRYLNQPSGHNPYYINASITF